MQWFFHRDEQTQDFGQTVCLRSNIRNPDENIVKTQERLYLVQVELTAETEEETESWAWLRHDTCCANSNSWPFRELASFSARLQILCLVAKHRRTMYFVQVFFRRAGKTGSGLSPFRLPNHKNRCKAL